LQFRAAFKALVAITVQKSIHWGNRGELIE
jgi:hypothetical protein